MPESDDQEPRVSRNPLLWPVRALLHSVLKVIVVVAMGIRLVFRPRAVRYGVAALLIAGAIGWSYAAPTLQGQVQVPALAPAATSQDPISVPATNQLPPSPTVESYLKAQANFDAKGMWDTISDQMKQQMNANPGTVQQLQTELDTARQQGRKYRTAMYVGGVPTSDGAKVFFYVLTVDTPSGPADVPYIYVVGQDGKIVSIQ